MNPNYSAFPQPENADTEGISYRQWMIGQVANGLGHRVGGDWDQEKLASEIITLADEIIEQEDESA